MFTSLWSASEAARQNNQTAGSGHETTTLPLASAAATSSELNPTEQAQVLINYFRHEPTTALQSILEWLNTTRVSYGGGTDYSLESWKGSLFAHYDDVPNKRLASAIITFQAMVGAEYPTDQARGDAALKKALDIINASRTGEHGDAFKVKTYSFGVEYHDPSLSNKFMLFLLSMVGTKADQFQVARHGNAICTQLQRIFTEQQAADAIARARAGAGDDIAVEELHLEGGSYDKSTDSSYDDRYRLG